MTKEELAAIGKRCARLAETFKEYYISNMTVYQTLEILEKDIPALLAEIERLTAENEALKEAIRLGVYTPGRGKVV